jgi:hypothetical protein
MDAIPAKTVLRHIPNSQRAALGLPLMGRPKAGTERVRAETHDAARLRRQVLTREVSPPQDRLRDQITTLIDRGNATMERWKRGER